LRLGANKASSTIAIDSLVDKLAEEAAEFATVEGNPWGSDDLIDINADADDWGAFESGPTSAGPNLTTSADSNDSSASWMAPSSQLSWGLSTTSTSSSQTQKPPLVIQSPNPWSQPSQLSNAKDPRSNTTGWGVNPLEEGSSTPKTAVSSPAVMTKEEKALEMIKRKEERKQRIAMLKEQKKAATKT